MSIYTEEYIRAIIEDRLREADKERLAGGARRRQRTATGRAAVRHPQQRSRLWSFVHFRRAYG